MVLAGPSPGVVMGALDGLQVPRAGGRRVFHQPHLLCTGPMAWGCTGRPQCWEGGPCALSSLRTPFCWIRELQIDAVFVKCNVYVDF